MILPKPAKEWGHMSVPLATCGKASTHVIDLILFRGEDELERVDLLEYPFLCHEMGHNALFKYGMSFADRFAAELERISNAMLRQSLPDRGAAKAHAQQTVHEIRQLWNPTPNHYNWAHEIAVDVIALWTCGPAYLASFQDFLENEDPNPYQIGQSHPPYAVRVSALSAASDQLGWGSRANGLKGIDDKWRSSTWKRERTNRYTACANPELVRACIDSSIAVCEALGLPKCTASTIQGIQKKLDEKETPELGAELLVAAWLARECSDEQTFIEWERRIVREHVGLLTL
jgi:hypothetical protein